MTQLIFIWCTIIATLPPTLVGITTIHHDKRDSPQQYHQITKDQREENQPFMMSSLERQKRLLPYMNYYRNHHQQQNNYNQKGLSLPYYNNNKNKEPVTPFLESNALPGPFLPISNEKVKNFNSAYTSHPSFQQIYDNLVLLKQQNSKHLNYFKPQHEPDTTITAYSPTEIDIDDEIQQAPHPPPPPPPQRKPYKNVIYKIFTPKPQIHQDYAVNEQQYDYVPTSQGQNVANDGIKDFAQKPIYLYRHNTQPQRQPVEKPTIIYTIQPPKPQVNAIIDDKYTAQKFIAAADDAHHTSQYQQQNPLKQYEPVQFLPSSEQLTTTPIKNTNTLGQLLKQLQAANTLPQTLTADNIDDSIRTLVDILGNLQRKKLTPKFSGKPIIVAEEENTDYDDGESSEKDKYEEVAKVTEHFPANTIEGGTPGRPGIDYPALSTIPPTSFNCKTQRYKGFFGDPHTNCQVWHYCDLNGGQASFLCPNGTIFSQVALTCDWWYNVKCDNTAQLYVLNERLYKYILPLAPKFPEDYSGPLVDKYLALKFKEMEDKLISEKKNETKTEVKNDSDELQDIQSNNNVRITLDDTNT